MAKKKSLIPGFSLNRALGVTSAKQKIARATGIPTTKQGRKRKLEHNLWTAVAVGTAAAVSSPAGQSQPNTQRASTPRFERKKFEVKAVGVTFQNEDGTERQKILAGLKEFPYYDDLSLEKYEYEDAPAYHIVCDGKVIGNVSATLAEKLYDFESRGYALDPSNLRVYGGPDVDTPDRSYGASIDLTIVSPDEIAYLRNVAIAKRKHDEEMQRDRRSAQTARKVRSIALLAIFVVFVLCIIIGNR